MLIREATDADSDAVIQLIEEVFSEYPGCVLDVDAEEPHLRGVATAFAAWRGRIWVVEAEGRVIACCGYRAARDPSGLELKHLYVTAAARGRGLGNTLTEMVEHEAARSDAAFVELWTDTRFTEAHRLYARRGYERGPHTRQLHDLSQSEEFYFCKRMRYI